MNKTQEFKKKSMLVSGNEAVVYGALFAGCGSYFGYPITPAGEIIESAAKLFPKLNRVFLQAESEVAAINMVMGASAAGHRAMTGSSGLGISLKQEAISYMAAMELGGVIVDITRCGPGLGNIAVEQSDYNQVVKGGGHGGYNNIVLAPNSAQEMCDFAKLAFDLSDKYSNLVYILGDSLIGQMIEKIDLPTEVVRHVPSPKSLGNSFDRENYFTSIYMEPQVQHEHEKKLQNKFDLICKNEQRSESYLLHDAKVVLVAYGISSRISKDAVDKLRKKGIKAGLLRPITLYPFPEHSLKSLLNNAEMFFSVELSNGQMIDDIKLAIECKKEVKLINQFGGLLYSSDDIVGKVVEYYDK